MMTGRKIWPGAVVPRRDEETVELDGAGEPRGERCVSRKIQRTRVDVFGDRPRDLLPKTIAFGLEITLRKLDCDTIGFAGYRGQADAKRPRSRVNAMNPGELGGRHHDQSRDDRFVLFNPTLHSQYARDERTGVDAHRDKKPERNEHRVIENHPEEKQSKGCARPVSGRRIEISPSHHEKKQYRKNSTRCSPPHMQRQCRAR